MNPIPEMKAVRDKRLRNRITQQALATKAGIALPYLVNLETGRNDNPTLKVVHAINKALRDLIEAQRPHRAKPRTKAK